MDPIISTILYGGGLALAGYFLGRSGRAQLIDFVANSTIDTLIERGYIATYKDDKGEEILLKVGEKRPK